MEPLETGFQERIFGEFVDEEVAGELFELVVEDDDELEGEFLEGLDNGEQGVFVFRELVSFQQKQLAGLKDIL